MTKNDLITKICEKGEYKNKKEAEKALKAVIDTISDALVAGEKVQLIGFGTFEVRDRKEKKSKNPQTGADIIVPAKKAPAFKAGKTLKDAVNN